MSSFEGVETLLHEKDLLVTQGGTRAQGKKQEDGNNYHLPQACDGRSLPSWKLGNYRIKEAC